MSHLPRYQVQSTIVNKPTNNVEAAASQGVRLYAPGGFKIVVGGVVVWRALRSKYVRRAKDFSRLIPGPAKSRLLLRCNKTPSKQNSQTDLGQHMHCYTAAKYEGSDQCITTLPFAFRSSNQTARRVRVLEPGCTRYEHSEILLLLYNIPRGQYEYHSSLYASYVLVSVYDAIHTLRYQILILLLIVHDTQSRRRVRRGHSPNAGVLQREPAVEAAAGATAALASAFPANTLGAPVRRPIMPGLRRKALTPPRPCRELVANATFTRYEVRVSESMIIVEVWFGVL